MHRIGALTGQLEATQCGCADRNMSNVLQPSVIVAHTLDWSGVTLSDSVSPFNSSRHDHRLRLGLWALQRGCITVPAGVLKQDFFCKDGDKMNAQVSPPAAPRSLRVRQLSTIIIPFHSSYHVRSHASGTHFHTHASGATCCANAGPTTACERLIKSCSTFWVQPILESAHTHAPTVVTC